MSIADPFPGKIPRQHRTFYPKYFQTDGFLSYRSDPCLDDAPFPDLRQPIGCRRQVEGALLAQHGIFAAGNDASAGCVESADDKINLAAHHVVDQSLQALGLSGITAAGITLGNNHFSQRDGDPATLVVDDRQTVTFNAIHCAAQNAVGQIGVGHFMPESILLRTGQGGCIVAFNRQYGTPPGSGGCFRCGFLLGGTHFGIYLQNVFHW